MTDPYEKNSDANEIKRLRQEVKSEDLRSLVERIIDDAQAKGAFENLPGQGKPLVLEETNPFANDREVAYKLLKDNNFTLPWIAARNASLNKIDAFRQKLARSWSQAEQRYRIAPDKSYRAALRLKWRRQYDELLGEVTALNREIADTNLQLPVTRLKIMELDLPREIAVIGGSEELSASNQ